MISTEDTMENAIIKDLWAMDKDLPSGLVVVIRTSQNGGKKKDMFVLKRQLTNSMEYLVEITKHQTVVAVPRAMELAGAMETVDGGMVSVWPGLVQRHLTNQNGMNGHLGVIAIIKRCLE